MIHILAIETSCDDTSAAISCNNKIKANIIANQKVHEQYGGVVPELASRAHQQNIVPVVDIALKKSNLSLKEIDAVAFTLGPGLLGSLLVGASFAKTLSLAINKPLITVDHLEAHTLSHFIAENDEQKMPQFPFLCLLVSGGHTQIMLMKDYFSNEIIGETIDDAAGEAYDKAAKIMGLQYPGGPIIDKLSVLGNHLKYKFAEPQIPDLNFSFSGLKTSFLYFIRDNLKNDPNFIEINKNDLAASIQFTINNMLVKKLIKASKITGIKQIAIAGGVSANNGLRKMLYETSVKMGWDLFIPKFEYTTDNAAMVAVSAYYKYLKGEFSNLNITPYARKS